jgi:hypothetical protein
MYIWLTHFVVFVFIAFFCFHVHCMSSVLDVKYRSALEYKIWKNRRAHKIRASVLARVAAFVASNEADAGQAAANGDGNPDDAEGGDGSEAGLHIPRYNDDNDEDDDLSELDEDELEAEREEHRREAAARRRRARRFRDVPSDNETGDDYFYEKTADPNQRFSYDNADADTADPQETQEPHHEPEGDHVRRRPALGQLNRNFASSNFAIDSDEEEHDYRDGGATSSLRMPTSPTLEASPMVVRKRKRVTIMQEDDDEDELMDY